MSKFSRLYLSEKAFVSGVFISLFFLFCSISHAQSDALQLTKLSELSHYNKDPAWLTPYAIPNNGRLIFAHQSGKILFTSTTQQNDELALNLKNALNPDTYISLTAISTHPSFSLRDHAGNGVIFTAHIEHHDSQLKKNRLSVKDKTIENRFDLVVNQWQLNQVNKKTIDTSTLREVIRIAVPSKNILISQLSFNPYVQSWDDDYGQLFITLTHDEQTKHFPLLSGAILKINPSKFGLKNYTAPKNNPFTTNNSVANEIALFGAGDIHQIMWQKRKIEQLIIAHEYQNKLQISLSTLGQDWLSSKPKNILWQASTTQTHSKFLLYTGRRLSGFRDHIFFLSKEKENWLVNAVPLKSTNETNVKTFNNLEILGERIHLFENTDNEITLFDPIINTVISVSSEMPMAKDADLAQEPVRSNSSQQTNMIVLLIFVLISGIIAWYVFKFSPKRNLKYSLLRSQYARFDLDTNTNEIMFFHRHRSAIDCRLALTKIKASEIQLNDNSINLINVEPGYSFNQTIENEVRLAFAKEYRDKMITEKTRQISIYLTDTEGKTYPICLYYRLGNQRLTKIKYDVVLETIIDWCWLIARTINPAEAGKRKITVKPEIKKASYSHTKTVGKSSPKPMAKKETNKVVNKEENNGYQSPKNNQTAEMHQQVNVGSDTEIVNALDKLVKLKQQGFLAEHEFELAKAKLLQELIDN